MAKSLNAKFVAQQITNGVYTLSPRRKGKSFIWNVITEIISDDNTVVDDLLFCQSCRRVLKCAGHHTSNLNRHKCCQALKQPQVLQTVAKADKKEVIDTCADWIIDDFSSPYPFINGTGFTRIAKLLIKIGATYGEHVDVNDIFSDATAITHKIQKTAEDKASIIRSEIKEVIRSEGAAATIAIWPDNYVKRNSIAVSLHYQKNFEFFDIILGLKSVSFEKSTGDHILRKLRNLFKQFDIDNIESIKFITDIETNLENALENNTRLNCSSHLFANVLDKSFGETTELMEIMDVFRKIAKYLKKTHMQHSLPSVENPCITHWNSDYTILKLVADNWVEVYKVLTETEEFKLRIPISALTALVELCKDFEIIFEKLQTCNSPSLCFVLPSIAKIKRLCKPKSEDIPGMLMLKENIIRNVIEIWESNLSIWHKAAFFLFPPALNMQQSDIKAIKEFCTTQIQSFEGDVSKTDVNTSHASPDIVPEIKAVQNSSLTTIANTSSKQTVPFFFDDIFEESVQESEGSAKREVDRYSRENVSMDINFDIIEWWENHEINYPRLSKLAMQIHSIPASSAAAERAFSLAGNFITEKRSRLRPRSLNNLLFLHSYYKNYEQ